MIITFERASKQAGWDGDAFEDKIWIKSYYTDEDLKTRLCTSVLTIEAETFGIEEATDSLSVSVRIFSDAVDLLASGRVVRGLRNIQDAMSLDVVEGELASAGIPELIVLSEGGEPRIIDNRFKPNPEIIRKDALALYILGCALFGKPAMLGTTEGDKSEAEAREAIERAREIADSLGYPENMIVVQEIRPGKGKKTSSNDLLGGGFMAPGSGNAG